MTKYTTSVSVLGQSVSNVKYGTAIEKVNNVSKSRQ